MHEEHAHMNTCVKNTLIYEHMYDKHVMTNTQTHVCEEHMCEKQHTCVHKHEEHTHEHT